MSEKKSHKKINGGRPARHWCFTIWSDNFDHESAAELVRGMVVQKELCPSTNRIHWQGYLEFSQPIRMSGVKKLFGDDTMHLGTRFSGRDNCIDYCSKSRTRVDGPWMYGSCKVKSGKGQRTDLQKIANDVKTLGLSGAIDNNPAGYLRFTRGMESLARHYQPRPGNWRTVTTECIIGLTGLGKTRWAYETYPELYKVQKPKRGQQLWFDGYVGQSVLLIDEYRGWIDYSLLLQLLDGYPVQLQIKGGVTWANWTKVIITSNDPIESWHKNQPDISPLLRRIHSTTYWRGCVKKSE